MTMSFKGKKKLKIWNITLTTAIYILIVYVDLAI